MNTIKSTKDSLKDRLGSDLKFPIEAVFEPISGLDLLIQDIQLLLLTIPGERLNRPDFGCSLRNQMWENMEDAKVGGKASIEEALELHEPRISVTNISAVSNDATGLITFNIQFIVKSTDVSSNLVFPLRVGSQLSFS